MTSSINYLANAPQPVARLWSTGLRKATPRGTSRSSPFVPILLVFRGASRDLQVLWEKSIGANSFTWRREHQEQFGKKADPCQNDAIVDHSSCPHWFVQVGCLTLIHLHLTLFWIFTNIVTNHTNFECYRWLLCMWINKTISFCYLALTQSNLNG